MMKKELKIQINGKMLCVHGFEDSLLLKCPYYAE
jgi:hypothetical protein